MARLFLGEQRLRLPHQDQARLYREAISLIPTGDEKGVIKLIVTRGVGGRGYRPQEIVESQRIISFHPRPEISSSWYMKGIRLRVCDTRLGRNSLLAGIKHLNRLEQVLARMEWDDAEIAEGLMLDELDCVIEGTQSNLFFLKAGQLITPDLTHCGVAGVMRKLVLELAADLGIPCKVARVRLEDLASADAIFITNSLLGICPVFAIADYRYDISLIPQTLVGQARRYALADDMFTNR